MVASIQPYITGFFVGISVGCMYALVALSYNLVYSATGVFNFAQGDLLTLGGLLAYTFLVSHPVNALIAVVPIALAVAIVGLAQERITVAPLRRQGAESLAWVITTLGASVVLQNVFQLIWGSQSRPVPALVEGRPVVIWHSPIARTSIIIVGVALVVALSLELWSRRSLAGRAWAATAEDGQAALARGIDIRRVGALSFLIGGAIAGVGGLVTVPATSAVFNTGSILSLEGFVAITLGGFGSHLGALAGGILLGIVESEAVLLIDPGYRNVVALAVLVLVLLLRPQGLFGHAKEREV